MESSKTMIGTVVGESTPQEFRMSITPGQVYVQDLVALDAEIQESGKIKQIRVWAKIEDIERINPLFPREAGQELADLQVNPFDTVISMSREMITASCRILGYEEISGGEKNEPLKKLRYPPQPASSVYKPPKADIQRIIMGNLDDKSKKHRKLDIGWLSTRRDVDLIIDAHPIVARHAAILAMTGAGKSWTAKRIVEQLAEKQYPIVIFDPHGEYSGLSEIEAIKDRVHNYYADIKIFEEEQDDIVRLINGLGRSELTPRMQDIFTDLFRFSSIIIQDQVTCQNMCNLLLSVRPDDQYLQKYGLSPNLFGIAAIGQCICEAIRGDNQSFLSQIDSLGYTGVVALNNRDAETINGIVWRTRRAAGALANMARINRKISMGKESLPTDINTLIKKGSINVIGLAGYSSELRASIYSLVVEKLFQNRIQNLIDLPFLLVLEEAHNFAPGAPTTDADRQALQITRQIAQEGRKFGVGFLMISQRPSRLDETALSQCNTFIIMRLVNPADQQFVKRVIETVGEKETKLLPDLDVGEAIISGQSVQFPVLAQIKSPQATGSRSEEDLIMEVSKYGG